MPRPETRRIQIAARDTENFNPEAHRAPQHKQLLFNKLQLTTQPRGTVCKKQ